MNKAKRCPRCTKTKNIGAFSWRDVKLKTRRKSWCNECCRGYQRERVTTVWTRVSKNLRVHTGVWISELRLRDHLGLPTTCYLCGDEITSQYEVDHVTPRSRGGATTLENLAWTHRSCNRAKHDMPIPEFVEVIRKILLRHGD